MARDLIPENTHGQEQPLLAHVDPKYLYMRTRFPLVKMKILQEELEYVDKCCYERGIKFTTVRGFIGVTSDHRRQILIGFRREDERHFYKLVKPLPSRIMVTDKPNI